jgi:anti-anti-sigma regulatory factor
VIVDLSYAEFVDSSIIHVLFEADRQGRERGRPLTLLLASDSRVRRILEINGLLEHFACPDSREQAIASARRQKA